MTKFDRELFKLAFRGLDDDTLLAAVRSELVDQQEYQSDFRCEPYALFWHDGILAVRALSEDEEQLLLLFTSANKEVAGVDLARWVIAWNSKELSRLVAARHTLLAKGFRDVTTPDIAADQPWGDSVDLLAVWFRPGEVILECSDQYFIAKHELARFDPATAEWSTMERRRELP